MIAALTTAFIKGIQENPGCPPEVSSAAEVELAGGIPLVSNAQLEEALGQTGLAPSETEAILAENEEARIAALRASLSILALFAVLALYFTRLIPREPVGTPSGIPRRSLTFRPPG